MEDKETGRLEAFSDGVFAVAITLLVLNFRIPEAASPDKLLDDPHLWQVLLGQWPMLAAYVTSFATIGIMWLNHHRLFQHIRHIDTGLLLMNLLLLLIIVFVPVPTALLAEYFIRPDLHAAAVLYSSTFLAMACCFNLLWRYASYDGRLLGKNVDPRSVAAISRQYLFGPFLYLLAFGLSWFSTPASIVFAFILALFFARSPRSLPSSTESVSLSRD